MFLGDYISKFKSREKSVAQLITFPGGFYFLKGKFNR